ncbi:LiaF-related protein [Flavitalea sp. BT771]|uniref:LiaF transmembrane domain-containing protein n=1 Tax=Flavitalea sp. BT771 TaxID=3063329 RepID=UPI0026E13006|nr:LiaF domain-containing protein [Flavitalea sp. BT771]MDO6432971.1 LiaF-related protein [Flavitalea sp. BT771]MDV6221753.1 LiaF-related protein [Flavitalea sp. BT771]
MTDDKDKYVDRRSGRVGAGLFLLLIGGVLLVDQMGVPLPGWLFSWHVLLIAVGLFLGLRHNFRGGSWAILILVGGFFLLQDTFPDIPLRRFAWPAALIFIGLVIIFSPRRHSRHWRNKWRENWKDEWGNKGYTQGFSSTREGYSSEDFVDSTAIFGGVHKKVVSKNFKGGDITSIMGGTELDLTQADFTGVIHLDVTQVMGGTKIIVPPHWEVRCEVSAMFAGFEDKRQQPAITNPDKVLIIDGTSIFGGIELKNF